MRAEPSTDVCGLVALLADAASRVDGGAVFRPVIGSAAPSAGWASAGVCSAEEIVAARGEVGGRVFATCCVIFSQASEAAFAPDAGALRGAVASGAADVKFGAEGAVGLVKPAMTAERKAKCERPS